MHIVYDHQVTSLQDAGGASRYHYELARHISQEPGVQVSMYLGLNRNVYPYALLKNAGVRVSSIPTQISPGMLRYAINEVLTRTRLLLARKCDIYHATLYRGISGVNAGARVVTHHDCTQERFPDLFRNADQIKRAKAKLFRDVDLIICVSRSSQKDLLEYYDIAESKTRVIHHGLSPLPVPYLQQATTRAISRRPYILYVGARHSYKNCAALLQAFAESRLYSDFDLLLVGGGRLSDAEQQQIEGLGIVPAIRQRTVASDADLAAAYAGASLLVYPSLYEGFGFPPLEAMSVGCIVLAAYSSSIPEICGEVPYYFDPHDHSSLVTMLVEAINGTDHQQRVSAGRRLTASYQWAKCASRTLEAYRDVS